MAVIDYSMLVTAEMKAAEAEAATLALLEAGIQRHIDETARERGYRDGFALASYIGSTVPQWAAEAAAFVAWRDQVWSHAYAERDEVTAGVREMPSMGDFIDTLPEIEWPD